MRRVSAIFYLFFIGSVAIPRQANGRPPYFEAFKAKYAPDEQSEYGKLINTTKCNVCHVDKLPKTKRNVYGTALSKSTGKNQKDKSKINEALQKTESEKSPSGKTFGEIIKEEKLPGA